LKKPVFFIIFIAILAIFLMTASCKKADSADDLSVIVNEVTPKVMPYEINTTMLYTADASDIIESRADKAADTEDKSKPALSSWWADWGIFTNYSSATKVDDMLADAATTGCSMTDCSSGLFFDMQTWIEGGEKDSWTFNLYEKHYGAVMEGVGDARNILVAMHQNEDGTYEINDKTGAANVITTHWGWEHRGPHINNHVNTVAWCGMPAFINNAPWQSPYILDNYPEVDAPTYPDGRSALGYKDGYLVDGMILPDHALLWDACGAKDLNGSYHEEGFAMIKDSIDADNYSRDAVVMADGTIKYAIGDFAYGKDENSPFWLQYARLAVRTFIGQGATSFWVDNYIGWDTLGNNPLEKAFGDWSVYKFNKEFVPAHPELGITDPNFNITDYLRNKFDEIYPDGDNMNISWNNGGWKLNAWEDDAVWRAYLAFKSDSIHSYAQGFYAMVKEEAVKAGKNPDDINVSGNDFCYMHSAVPDGKILDTVATEYGPEFNVVAGFNYDGFPPRGRMGGVFALLPHVGVSNHASFWYYGGEMTNSTVAGMAVGYQAMAYNHTINSGDENSLIIGTDKSARDVNRMITNMRNVFDNRELYSDIGIYYSSNSEYVQLAPGGYVDGSNITATVGYAGWAYAFESLHIPFKTIVEFKLAELIDTVSVLIMPGTRCIDIADIDTYIKPFLDNGGTLIVTGEKAGLYETKKNIFAKHDSNLLEDLATNYSGNGKVYFFDFDPAQEYYRVHKDLEDDYMAEVLKPVADLMEEIFNANRAVKQLEVSGFNNYTVMTVQNDFYTNKFFVDIVNLDVELNHTANEDGFIDHSEEKFNPTSGTIKVRLPARLLKNGSFAVFLTKADDKAMVQLSDVKLENGWATIDIGEFEVYTSISFIPA